MRRPVVAAVIEPVPDLDLHDDSTLVGPIKEALEPLERSDGENPYVVHEDLRKMMQTYVGIVRTEEDLTKAIEEIGKLRERAKSVSITGNVSYNPGWHLALDLKNMLDISEALARAALAREESRGGHTREDFPDSDAEVWGKQNNIIRKTADGSMELTQESLPPVPPELAKLLEK